MHSMMLFIKETLMNIKNILVENEIRSLKLSDEYAFRQLGEYMLLKNSKKCFVFSVIQFIIGILFFVFSISEEKAEAQGSFLKIIGSVTLIAVSVLFFLYYKSELSRHKHDFSRLRIIFYLFWNLFTVGSFFISAGYYHAEKSVFIFVIFAVIMLSVPVFRVYESLVSAAVYIVPCIYYGVLEKCGVSFYISVACASAAFFWINAVKSDFYIKNWINRKKLRDVSERCSSILQTDNLTGMLNRAGLVAKFRERYENRTESHKIAVIMADIDNFRLYNHKYGFDRSDGCLYNICNCIRIISKPVTDIVSRFGGDDFILVLEDMDELEVVKFAEQIRAAVETMALPFGENGIVTISIGISGITELENEDTYSRLLNEADLQLMIAKNSGKNCIGYRNRAFIQENRRNKG